MRASNTYLFAERELDILSKSLPDPDNRPIVEPFRSEILALCNAFGNNGESGGSAPCTAGAIVATLKKLLLQRPIMPMTGIDEEWNKVSEDDPCIWQNNRCSNLFKNSEGRAWYLDAIVWKDQNNTTYSGSAYIKYRKHKPNGIVLSRQCVKSFPFTPKTFYIDVISKEVKPHDWDHYIRNPKQLDRVFKYYDRYE
jgi:hypothetical protein